MSTTGGDRRRLEELRCLYRQMREVDMPVAMQNELDQVAGQLIAAAECADRILEGIAAAMSLLLEICGALKKRSAPDDG